jgi:hypothetical protein
MSLIMSSVITLRLNRRRAFSNDSPSCSRTSAILTTPKKLKELFLLAYSLCATRSQTWPKLVAKCRGPRFLMAEVAQVLSLPSGRRRFKSSPVRQSERIGIAACLRNRCLRVRISPLAATQASISTRRVVAQKPCKAYE